MRIRTAALAAVVTAATAAGLAAAPALAATPATATAVTHVVNRPDGGNGGTWAYDDFTRTLVVTVAASQAGVPAGEVAYTATVTDKGTFTAVEGSDTPNQAVAAAKVAHAVKGTIDGSITYTVTAPTADALASIATATENDNYAAPAAADTTANWPQRVFASSTGVTVTEGSAWSWTYATACEKWTDSAANGDGNTAADGNITGKACAVPVLSHGHGAYWEPTREKVGFEQSAASWDEFTIVGPGFNGQHGWVDGVKGLNTAYYEGLTPHHGYTVLYTPVAGQGSTRQIAGTHTGYVYFVSDVPTAS